ncbi:hypothetical protein [Haloplanus salilacus]|uniref:hypothetical protein n=1 Tax=Haloplanus salilacus TaxID=2949994 RepID=UPI0030D4BB31
MIPNNLPYRTFPREWVDEPPTWYQYIIGEFDSEMWYERDEVPDSLIDPMHYQPFEFKEELNHLHEQFLIFVRASRIDSDLTEAGCLEHEWEVADGPMFTYDEQCRFDIWTLYNQPNKEVELDIGGTARIKTLPIQSEISDVPPLQDTVPSDVPLICGPQLHTPVGEPSIPGRPFGKSTFASCPLYR